MDIVNLYRFSVMGIFNPSGFEVKCMEDPCGTDAL
jgi:hypothetical protein